VCAGGERRNGARNRTGWGGPRVAIRINLFWWRRWLEHLHKIFGKVATARSLAVNMAVPPVLAEWGLAQHNELPWNLSGVLHEYSA
jgi:hypothetical protein